MKGKLNSGFRLTILPFLFYCIFPNSAQPADKDCDAILKYGVYDTAYDSTDEKQVQSFIKQYSSEQTDKMKAEGSYGLYSGHLDNDWENKVQQYEAGNSNYRNDVVHYAQTINQTIVQAWSNCKSETGLHIYVRQLSDTQFELQGIWNPRPGEEAPKVIGFECTSEKGGDACPLKAIDKHTMLFFGGGFFVNHKCQAKGKTFKAATLYTQTFYRTNIHSGTVHVAVKTQWGLILDTFVFPPNVYVISGTISAIDWKDDPSGEFKYNANADWGHIITRRLKCEIMYGSNVLGQCDIVRDDRGKPINTAFHVTRFDNPGDKFIDFTLRITPLDEGSEGGSPRNLVTRTAGPAIELPFSVKPPDGGWLTGKSVKKPLQPIQPTEKYVETNIGQHPSGLPFKDGSVDMTFNVTVE